MFEFKNFANGTKQLMDAVVQATQNGAVTIIGMYFKQIEKLQATVHKCENLSTMLQNLNLSLHSTFIQKFSLAKKDMAL